MASFLETANLNQAGLVHLSIPKPTSKFNDRLYGELYVSENKFVYSTISKTIVWFKFLGIGLGLPLIALAAKVKELVSRCFKKPVPSKGFHDWQHSGKLISIAWKAVLGLGRFSILEDVDKFGLAELDYNNPDRIKELDKTRSARLANGVYLAKCMHPLFHESQFTAPQPLRKQLEQERILRTEVEKSLQIKTTPKESSWSPQALFNSLNSFLDPYPNKTVNQLTFELMRLNNQILAKEILLDRSVKCDHYAREAILKQQSVCQNATETVEECTCCNITCYKHQQVCGLIHKIDCCGTRCWAIDCLCCMFCFWPDGQQVCVI